MRSAVRSAARGAQANYANILFWPKTRDIGQKCDQANIMQTFGLVQAKQANLCIHVFACICVVRCTVLFFAETVLI